MAVADSFISGSGYQDAANPQAVADATAGASEPQLTFSLTVKKTPGASLGIDVTYSCAAVWTRNGLFITKVFEDGIVAAWNTTSEEPCRVRQGDFILQVNEVHGDTVAMIQEMKVKKQLKIHVLRRAQSPNPTPTLMAADAASHVDVSNGNGTSKVAQISVESLKPQFDNIEDEALVGLLVSVLRRRPWICNAVLEIADTAPPTTELAGEVLPPVDAQCNLDENSGVDIAEDEGTKVQDERGRDASVKDDVKESKKAKKEKKEKKAKKEGEDKATKKNHSDHVDGAPQNLEVEQDPITEEAPKQEASAEKEGKGENDAAEEEEDWEKLLQE